MRGRRALAGLAGVAIALGLGLGLMVGRVDTAVDPDLGLWVAVLAGLALAVLLATMPTTAAPVESSEAGGWMDFRRELRRARRHGRPLTLMRIPVGADVEPADPEVVDAQASGLSAMARRIGVRLRLIDRSWAEDGSIYVMLPESTQEAAERVLVRIEPIVPAERLALVRIASFPHDGLTSGAIIAAVHDGAMDQAPTSLRPAVLEPAGMALDDDIAVGEVARR